MEFEFDIHKSKINQDKHGIDFIKAQELWNDPERMEIPTKHVEEPRFVLIAMLNTTCWSAVFTYRKQKIRLISVRRSRKDEKELYKSDRV